jgi:hypothetical protein
LVDAGRGGIDTLQPAQDRPGVKADGQRRRSFRCSASSISVSPSPGNRPLRLSRLLTGSTRTPSLSNSNWTSSPGAISRRSRIALGITTCPFGPTLLVIPTSITRDESTRYDSALPPPAQGRFPNPRVFR